MYKINGFNVSIGNGTTCLKGARLLYLAPKISWLYLKKKDRSL